jgi:cytochrome c-type biogenesis protein CcmE
MKINRKQKRASLLIAALVVLGSSAGLMLYALSDTIVFFFTPAEVLVRSIEPDTRFRLGGLVAEGSLKRNGTAVAFTITDGQKTLPVAFTGQLPDLFREGQGVVAEGKLDRNGVFIADTVLAKHDENYMPKEVADALKKKGLWQGQGQKKVSQ